MRKSKNSVDVKESGNIGFYVYIGVTIKGVIQHGTIFKTKEDALDMLSPFLGKYPDVPYLVVPNTELADARLRVKESGNTYYNANQRIINTSSK